jgi:hypothetical protein
LTKSFTNGQKLSSSISNALVCAMASQMSKGWDAAKGIGICKTSSFNPFFLANNNVQSKRKRERERDKQVNNDYFFEVITVTFLHHHDYGKVQNPTDRQT